VIWFILPGRICGKEVSEEPVEGLVNTNLNPYLLRMFLIRELNVLGGGGVLVHRGSATLTEGYEALNAGQ